MLVPNKVNHFPVKVSLYKNSYLGEQIMEKTKKPVKREEIPAWRLKAIVFKLRQAVELFEDLEKKARFIRRDDNYWLNKVANEIDHLADSIERRFILPREKGKDDN